MHLRTPGLRLVIVIVLLITLLAVAGGVVSRPERMQVAPATYPISSRAS
jgi:hypothetical protein